MQLFCWICYKVVTLLKGECKSTCKYIRSIFLRGTLANLRLNRTKENKVPSVSYVRVRLMAGWLGRIGPFPAAIAHKRMYLK